MTKRPELSDKTTTNLRTRRIFSATFKEQKVKEIEKGLLSITQASKLYKVSCQSIYKWLYKYSTKYEKGVVQVVQMESEAKKTEELLKRVSELEQVVGQKQLEIDYLNKLLELSSLEFKVDIKKNFDTRPSTVFIKNTRQKPIE
jgi:transposase